MSDSDKPSTSASTSLVEIAASFRVASGHIPVATVVHSDGATLELLYQDGDVAGCFGPLNLLHWQPIAFTIGAIRQAIATTGLLDASEVRDAIGLVRRGASWFAAAQVVVPTATPADVVTVLRQLAAAVASQLSMTPGERSVSEAFAQCGLDEVQVTAAKELIETRLVKGRSDCKLTKPLQVSVPEQAQVVELRKLGKKRDLSDYRAEHVVLRGNVRGFINDAARSAIFFHDTLLGRVDVDFDANKVGTSTTMSDGRVNLEVLARLNRTQAQCTLAATKTKGPAGAAVYAFDGLDEELPASD